MNKKGIKNILYKVDAKHIQNILLKILLFLCDVCNIYKGKTSMLKGLS